MAENLRNGPPIDEFELALAREVYIGGFLEKFIKEPAKVVAAAEGFVTRSEWMRLFFALRDVTPEVLTHEELDRIDKVISNGEFGTLWRMQEAKRLRDIEE
jgi:hypothetical protein